MIQISISSLVQEQPRELRFPGFTNTFLIGKLKLDQLPDVRYVCIDKQSMVVLVDDIRLSDLIYSISSFLAYRTQNQLDEYIRLIQEYGE